MSQQLVKHYFWICLVSASRRDQHLKWKAESRRPSSPKHVGVTQSIESVNRTKRKRKGKFVLCLNWGDRLLLPSDNDTYWFLGLEVSLSYTTGFLGSPACRKQFRGLLYIYLSPIGSVPLKNPDSYRWGGGRESTIDLVEQRRKK